MAGRRARGRRTALRDAQPPLRVAPVLGLSLMLLVGGWTALWLFARYEALATFHGWMATEHTLGRAWSCPGEHVGGFPLGIVLTCDHPTFRGPIADGLFDGEMGGLKASAKLYFPTNVVVTLRSPLRASEVGGPRRLAATWSDADLTLRGSLPADLDRGELAMTDLRLGGDVPGAETAATARIGHLAVAFKPVSRTSGPRIDVEATLTADDATIPALDAAVGTASPIELAFKGFATQVSLTGGLTLPEVLDPWTAAGGQVHIESVTLDKGPFRMTGAGRLGLDDEHRLAGRLDAGFSGLDPVAARLGLPVGAVKVGNLLAGFLGGTSPDTAPATQSADLSLPLVAKDGRLYLGPVKTGVRLLPLY